MVAGRAVIATFAAVMALGAAASAKPGTFDYYYPQASMSSLSTVGRTSYGKKLCYDAGERAIGAKGYPAVPYMPCCSGKPPLPMDPKMKSYSEKEHYGLWCGGTGKVVPQKDQCYKKGERAIGAPGKPMVDYMPCCDGREPQSMYGDWGLFCGLPEPYAPKPTVPEKDIPTKCAGEEGYPYVDYVACKDGYKCAREPKYGWGFYCVPTGKSCYGPGVRGQGAKGYPAIDYMPCCDGQEMVTKYGEWGKFCPGKKEPVYEEPKPDYYKPYGAPKDYEPEPAPKGYAPPSYDPYTMPTPKPTYPSYSKSKKPIVTTVAPTTTAANALTEVFGEDFGCTETGTGTPAVPSGTVDPDAVATTNIDVDLPSCENGGRLSQEDAEALLQSLCEIAQNLDPQAECIIEAVPAVRMVELENGLPVAVRQGGGFRIVIVWFIIVNFAQFFAAVAATFGAAIVASQGETPTAEA